jgi:hypothetical protein
MISIVPIQVGLLIKTGVLLEIKISAFEVDADTTTVEYAIFTSDSEKIINGIYHLTPVEYNSWGEDNAFITDVITNYLGVTKID